jgi:hypothetical protein
MTPELTRFLEAIVAQDGCNDHMWLVLNARQLLSAPPAPALDARQVAEVIANDALCPNLARFKATRDAITAAILAARERVEEAYGSAFGRRDGESITQHIEAIRDHIAAAEAKGYARGKAEPCERCEG